MGHPMRRTRQLLPHEETVEMFRSATSGVLAVLGEDGYPYAVPLSFAYKDGEFYFHCATTGHKLDAVAHCDKASFCVIAEDSVVQSTFTTHFRSAIAFGRIAVIEDEHDKRRALMLLAEKYSPDHLDDAGSEIDKSMKRTCVLRLTVEEMTGKAAIELVQGQGPQS